MNFCKSSLLLLPLQDVTSAANLVIKRLNFQQNGFLMENGNQFMEIPRLTHMPSLR